MASVTEKIENLKIEFDEKRILRLIGYKTKSIELKDPVKN